jgi:hypothetical protein
MPFKLVGLVGRDVIKLQVLCSYNGKKQNGIIRIWASLKILF